MDGNESRIQNECRDIKEGDIVKWFELYHEGIVKNGGLGAVLQKREIDIGGPITFIQYEIWRFQKNDIMIFGPAEIEQIEETNN